MEGSGYEEIECTGFALELDKGQSKAVKKAGARPDAEKVKRHPSPYIVFCSEMRSEIKYENPTATFGDLGKLLGKRWGSLTDVEKKV